MTNSYFADTYALVEYLRGNRAFARIIEEEEWSTSILNLIELYFAVLRDNDEKLADRALLAFRRHAVDIADADIRTGMGLRLRHKAKKLDLSYADAVGYAMAMRLHTEFLTGDRAFEGFDGVKHVK